MKKPLRIFFFMIAAATSLAIIAAFIYLARPVPEDETPRPLQVIRGDFEISILATGEVRPENRLEIKPPLAGRIEEVFAKEGSKVKGGDVLAWMSSNERAALLDAARAKGPEEVKHWEENYRPIPIIAPVDGTIIYRNVEAGQTFDGGTAIFAMSDRLLIKSQVDETDLSRIRLRQRARVTLDAYPKEPMMGVVHKISYESKIVQNVTTYTVDILTDRVPDFMRSGMTANVAFISSSDKNAVLVPSEALYQRDKETFVQVQLKNQSIEERKITAGLSDGKMTRVISGLEAGDIVLAPRLKNAAPKNQSPFGFGGGRPPGGGGRR